MDTEQAPPPPPASVVIPFRHGEPDGPTAVVIGDGHAPYYLFRDGRTQSATPAETGPDAKT